MGKIKASIRPTDQMIERVQNQGAEFFGKWMALNWAISFVATCEYAGYGPKRAQELFAHIRSEFARNDEYGNYDYSISKLQPEIERLLNMDMNSFFHTRLTLQEMAQKEKKKHESRQPTIRESIDAKKKLEAMQNLMFSK